MKRIPDGTLDYDGGSVCLDGEPFTGIEYWADEKEGRGETTYINGTQTGLTRGWYPSGAPKYEYLMLMGVYHGKNRRWHPNGQLAEEADYELGFDLRHKHWDKDGNLIEEFERDKNDPAFEQLKVQRETYKEEIEEEERRRKDSKES
jgi:antitoxin component YwqK of YwqJK toxin-antitoxin module